MIITSGEFRGCKLKTPKGLLTRPTSSKIKQAVFNICRFRLKDSFFLDLFAGSGAMGLEALSEGASFALFIEKDKAAISCIKENIARLKVEDKTAIFKDLSQLKKTNYQFQFVYIDPPYIFYQEKNFIQNILSSLRDNLCQDATIFLEVPSSKELNVELENFQLKNIRKYGSSSLITFEALFKL